MKNKKLLLKAISLGMALTLICSMFPVRELRAEEKTAIEEPEEQEKEIIEIRNTKDFLTFAENCYIDEWSSNKRVLLQEDIDLTDTDFGTVPVFAGVFDGQGHTISGFCYSGDGYVAGLFRYIEKGGVVENLTLKGEVTATQEKECIGGLCGVNYGTIYNCSFRGNVSGRNTVGGLVGVNEGNGMIQSSTAGGRVTGYYSTGGIVGKNHGTVTRCTNHACINNDTQWVEEDDEMGVGIFLSISLGESETELFSGVDTGGIAGHSDGTITGCVNYGRVGYEHTGYNIGGIAGRQSGVLSACTNHGVVYGRKDVGGIVGQMEPYIEIDEATSLLHAVNRLHDLMEKTLDDMQEGKNIIKGDLDGLVSYSEGAVDAGDALAGQMTDFVNDNMDQAQAVTERMEHIMEMLPDVFDDVYAAEDSFYGVNRELYVLADRLKDAGEISGEYVETDYNRLTLLSTVGGNILSLQHYPAEGDSVRLLAEPDRDYGLDRIRVVDAEGGNISVQQEDENSYTFLMPAANVRVEAYFSYQGEENPPVEEEDGDNRGEQNKETLTEEREDQKKTEDKGEMEEGDSEKENPGEEENGNKNPEKEKDQGSLKEETENEDLKENDKNNSEETEKGDSEEKVPETGTTEGSAAEDGTSGGGGSGEEAENPDAGNLPENMDGNQTEGEAEQAEEAGEGMSPVARVERIEYHLEPLMSNITQIFQEPETVEEELEPEESVRMPVVKLSSNLSGNASCEIRGDQALVTVVPDGAYTLGDISAADQDGQSLPVSRQDSGEGVYGFDVSMGKNYQVYISFEKLDKHHAVSGAKEDMTSALRRYQEAAERVNAIVQEIQNSSSASQEQLEQLSKELEEMSKATTSILSSLSVVSNVVGQQTLDQIGDAGKTMGQVLDQLQSAVDSVKSASRNMRSMVDYVNGQSPIRFSRMGQEFDVNREKLHEQLKGMSGSLQSLSGNASDYSDVLNEDLRAVNDQINVIFNILADNITDYSELNLEELYEDVDVENTESFTTGKTDNCINQGIVKGDINIGGIAGAMSIDEEDPEDSAAGTVDYQMGRRYFTKCLITGCVNEGHITAKKDGAGGIVGYMKHGIVVDSEGYGSVESTEGDYAGGICGESLTVIKRCYSLCSVSGGKNVGGIAGYANTIKDCYAMADCKAAAGRMGAIAGQTANYDDPLLEEEEARVSGNCYVGEKVYGIDNISYVGVAEPISYEELLTVENLPVQFRHLKVTFRVDDLYLGTQEVKFGEKLSNLTYPEIPKREGYYGVWPDCSDQVMTGNLLITGEYKEDVTVVESSGSASGTEGEISKPYAMVEQSFTEDTVLKAVIGDEEPPEQIRGREYVIYDITLENAEIGVGDTFAIRLYNPYQDAEVWGYAEGAWTELESKARGGYLQVDMKGTKEPFCVAEKGSRKWIIPAGTAGGAALLLLLVLWRKTAKTRKRKK